MHRRTTVRLSSALVNMFGRTCNLYRTSCAGYSVCGSLVPSQGRGLALLGGVFSPPGVSGLAAPFDSVFPSVLARPPTVFPSKHGNTAGGLAARARSVQPGRSQPPSLLPASPHPRALVCLRPSRFPLCVFFFRTRAFFFFVKVELGGLGVFFSGCPWGAWGRGGAFVLYACPISVSQSVIITFRDTIVSGCFYNARIQAVVMNPPHLCSTPCLFCYSDLSHFSSGSAMRNKLGGSSEHVPLRFGHHLGDSFSLGFCPVTWRFCA